ncbi:MAG: YceI family protein [Planctomycetaceae bacterium]|nr:YceI family protein [Planctomycetaceae bacterium]
MLARTIRCCALGTVLLALLAAFVGSFPAERQNVVHAAEPDAPALAAGDVDPATSRVYVRVGKRRLGHEHGVEGRIKSGRLTLDAADNAGEIVFDMTSFKADTDAGRKYVGLEGVSDADEQTEVTATMTGKGVLEVEKHPTATFTVKSSKVMKEKSEDGRAQYELTGEFDLHGKKQPLTVVAVAGETADGQQQIKGTFTIKQTDYGITPYRALGGLVAVTDELKIFGDLWVQQ